MKNSDFISTLRPEFISLIEMINFNGFRVGIVGGYVRDFKLGRIKTDCDPDYDCELRPQDNSSNLLDQFKALKVKISAQYKTQELPFEILRVVGKDFEAEISLPRLESFTDEFHHSNFTTNFTPDLDYKDGFKRRDFTFNAMMYEVFYEEVNFLDPLGGESDLSSRKINPCSRNTFSKDPVRFLRAIRFEILLSSGEDPYKLDQQILEDISKVGLGDFSFHYFKSEMFKSKSPLQFILRVCEQTGNLDGYSPEFGIIKKFDSLWIQDKRTSYLANALFLKMSLYKLFCSRLELGKQQQNFSPMPWRFEEMHVDKDWISKIKFLREKEEELIGFYFDSNLIDLSFKDIGDLCGINVNLDEVEDKHNRQQFKYSEQARIYFDNKKNK